MGDEGGTEKKDLIYSLCEHIWRTFSLPMFKDLKNVTSIPIGYKSDPLREKINISKKNYMWSFLGTTHGSSRYDLLDKLICNPQPSHSGSSKEELHLNSYRQTHAQLNPLIRT